MGTQPATSAALQWKTESIGNANAGIAFDRKSTTSSVRTISVRWDGDKVRGIRLDLFDGTFWKYGGYDDQNYTLDTYTFKSEEFLKTLTLRDSHYGYGSVRQIHFTTSQGQFQPGQPGFDNEVDPKVDHCVLVGFYGAVNVDNFINSLGFWVQRGGPPALSADDLYTLSDDAVRDAVSNLFTQQLKHSTMVSGAFFPNEPPLPFVWDPKQFPAFLNATAMALVCSSVGSSSLYGFSKCVNVPAAIAFYQQQLGTPDAIGWGQKLYNDIFPDGSRSINASFRDYMNNDGPKWAQALAAKVTSAEFVNQEMAKLLTEPNWLAHINLVFFKLKRLTGTDEPLQSVLEVWTKAYPDKGIVQIWESENFIPPQNFTQLPDEFLSDVNKALQIATQTHVAVAGHIIHGRRKYSHEYTYGLAVQRFLNAVSHFPGASGIVTHVAPDNKQTVFNTNPNG